MASYPETSTGSTPQYEIHRGELRALPLLLRRYWSWLVLSGLLTVVSTIYLRWLVNPHYYPYSNPLFQRYSFQFDFYCFASRFRHFHHAAFFANIDRIYFNYPASMAMIYELFYRFIPHAHAVFLSMCCLLYVVSAALFARALIKRRVTPWAAVGFSATALLFSQPVALQLYLANMEIFVWATVSLGLWAWFRGRFWLAAACFGVAASLKIFPFVFLSLLVSRKKYRELVFGVLTGAVLSIASLWALGPTFRSAYAGIEKGLAWFQRIYLLSFNPPESGIDHSLFALIKLPLYVAHKTDWLRYILRPFLMTEAIAGTALYFLVIRRLPSINQVLALTVAGVLLPPLSHDYTLLHMYAPWVLLVLFALCRPEAAEVRKPLYIAFACFLVLFSAEIYLVHDGLRFAGQIKAIALIVLLVTALRVPFRAGESADEPLSSSL